MNKKRKLFFATLSLFLFLIASGISLYHYQINVQAKESQEEIKEALTTTRNKIERLYSDDKTHLLNSSITKEKIIEAEQSLQTLSDLDLSDTQKKERYNFSNKIKTAKKMLSIQSSIHKKFKDEKIASNDIDFSQEEKELVDLIKTQPVFVKKMTEIIEQGKTQLAIKKELMLFFKDFNNLKVKETISRTQYHSFKEKIDSLPSENFKESLTEQLVAIQKSINEKEIKEQQEKEREREKQRAAIQKEQKETDKQLKSEAKKELNKEIIVSTDSSTSTSLPSSTPKETNQSQTNSESSSQSNPVVPPQQDGIEGLISRSSTSTRTDQIIGVVANGSSSTVYLFEKSGEQWQTVLSVPGRVGYNGVGGSYEGSGRTPKGAYSLGFSFGTGPNPGTNLAYKQITDHSYWISNPDDSQYNTWQERASSSSLDEHMSDYQTQYKYGITLNYANGVNGGSAFFVHVNGNGATAGCISVSESNMLYLMQRIREGAYIINVNNESELANY